MRKQMNLEYLERYLTTLCDDISAAEKELRTEDSQFHRRTFVRALFAAIEGWIYRKMSYGLEIAREKPKLFTPGEIALLLGESYTLDNKGNVISYPKYSPTAQSFLFAMTMSTKGYEPVPVDTNSKGWIAFNESIRIRNRLMHPKSLEDFTVSDSDLQTASVTSLWFFKEIDRHGAILEAQMRKEFKRMESLVKKVAR